MPLYYKVNVELPFSEIGIDEFTHETERAYHRPSGTRVMKNPDRFRYFTNWAEAKEAQLFAAKHETKRLLAAAEYSANALKILGERLNETPKQAAKRAFA